MESVVNTMKEVEEREKAAEQAREEAARRSSDACSRVEELKGMIRSAKDANDMVFYLSFYFKESNLDQNQC